MQSQSPRSLISPDRFQSSHSRWVALTHRAPSSHSSFLYGVKSTKIYCRPTCSARLARRANVEFYDTKDQARRDGFRPCKRCKPDDTTFVGEAEAVVIRTIALLRVENGDLTMKRGLKELAKEVGVTPSYLCRVFKKTMGVTIGAYMKEFEREPSEGETDSSVQSPSTVGSGVVDVETGLLTPATTVRSLSVLVEGGKEGPVEETLPATPDNMPPPPPIPPPPQGTTHWYCGDCKGPMNSYAEEALDLDFDFNEWFWNEDYLNDSIYR